MRWRDNENEGTPGSMYFLTDGPTSGRVRNAAHVSADRAGMPCPGDPVPRFRAKETM